MGGELDPVLMEALSSPSTYPGRPQVRVEQTHSSVVFLAADRAYKVKKPVVFDFLDYSTPARRRHACLEEVRVNRKLAPGIYLGVRAIVPTAEGFVLAGPDAPDAVDYAVEMARFSESETLAGAIAAGGLGHAEVREVAQALARFHAEAAQAPGGRPADVLQMWSANIEELARIPSASHWPLEEMQRFGEAFVRARGTEISRRAATGHVRDGHGDLRCEHVLIDPVRIVDRIEFDPALRSGDVALDVAFLTMDLELHRQGWAARELIGAYRHAGGSPGGEELRSFYAAYRALVRAKVELLAAGGEGAPPVVARRLVELADRLCWRARRPLAIVVCGSAASGKSTLAAELVRRTRLPVLASDVIRKRLAGLTPTARAAPEHYSTQFTHATYDLLSREALASLRLRGGTIVDATCRTRGQRALIEHRLGPTGCALLFVRCEVPLKVATERARLRIEAGRSVSDATPEIVAEQHRCFQPLTELPQQHSITIDAEQPIERQVAAISAAIDELLLGRVRALPPRTGAFTRWTATRPGLA